MQSQKDKNKGIENPKPKKEELSQQQMGTKDAREKETALS